MPATGQRALFNATDKYSLVRLVGQGSYGAALLVCNTGTGQLLIAKELNLAQMDAKERESVDSEIGILHALKHPNIVRYEECLRAGSVLYIVMEYADGGDLFQRVRALEAPMPEDEVLNLFAQVCLAIKHLHDRRILHRDLKTQNIFLTQGGIVKLGDFGLATCLRHTMQVAQTLCGTPNYFSPELVRGLPYANKSDIWSLGCVLYELLTRSFAFSASTIVELMRKICEEAPAPIPSHYSQPLQHLLRKMLAKEQSIRPNITAILRAHVLQSALVRIQALLTQQQQHHQQHQHQQQQQQPHQQLQQQQLPERMLSPTLQRGVCPGESGSPSSAASEQKVNCQRAAAARDQDLRELEDDILSEMQRRDSVPSPDHAVRNFAARTDDLGDTLLEEVNQALAGLMAKGPEDFGDDAAYAAAPPAQLAASPPCDQKDRHRRVSMGEVDGLLAELQHLDSVIGKP
eukprot:TRINITY_DN3118_c0_g5_i1.p1 TRINITY_DN3118_c0_g5~~TRINITY_DN3118_c0_g5_i1.p1  ORF type:complete len:477 (+),score=156.59 TRINITY_DN3118_c0_g5_i1:54-1433(+)